MLIVKSSQVYFIYTNTMLIIVREKRENDILSPKSPIIPMYGVKKNTVCNTCEKKAKKKKIFFMKYIQYTYN